VNKGAGDTNWKLKTGGQRGQRQLLLEKDRVGDPVFDLLRSVATSIQLHRVKSLGENHSEADQEQNLRNTKVLTGLWLIFKHLSTT
jgi:hypothetical protein